MSLRNDYTNDVLNTSMDGKRRYNMITNTDGTVSFVDATTYDQVGTSFGALDINTIANSVLDTMEEINANTSGLMLAGALAVKEISQTITTAGVPSLTTMNQNIVRKNGKNVEVLITGNNATTLTTNTNLFTIPEGYRPSNTIFRKHCAIRNSGTGATQFFLCTIGSDGTIRLEASLTPTSGMNELNLQATWIMA